VDVDALSQALITIKGVGPQTVHKLAKLGIYHAEDALFHFPIRYEDRTHISSIGSVQPGDKALIHGEILSSEVRIGRRRSLATIISDNTGELTIRQFHFSASQQRNLKRGLWVQCFGELREGPSGPELIHPEYRILTGPDKVISETSLTAIYPTTSGLGQATWRNLINAVLLKKEKHIPELISSEILRGLKLPTLLEALYLIHQPPNGTDTVALMNGVHPAQLRLAFEELLAHYLALREYRTKRQLHSAVIIPRNIELWPRLKKNLGFDLTRSQEKTICEVFTDLSSPRPCLRLIQGDVGCGKTVVAAAAALAVIESGSQVVLMAPTELLSEQHFQTFTEWFKDFGILPVWLTGRLTSKERQRVRESLASGSSKLAIGTHALFQEDVRYMDLGLVVVDEQHRFGVRQRLAMRDKGRNGDKLPHQLIMTATPIPRSLTMVLCADMDVSVIDEMPPGRQPIETVVMPNTRRHEIQQRVSSACKNGEKVYWVCSIISESDVLDAEAAVERAQSLKVDLPELRIALLHGRTQPSEKEATMKAFRAGDVDLLVATTVIEVGVDVPDATLMVIENAERLGLAQLHQLRGRIGRSDRQSVCVLMYQSPLSAVARDRLTLLKRSNDGFEISRKDLDLRGPGEILGFRQSGSPEFRIVDLGRHKVVTNWVKQAADLLYKENPELIPRLIHRWLNVVNRSPHV